MTQRNRINLTIPDDLHDLIAELSELTDEPKARIIRNLLYDLKPALQMTRDGLLSLKNNQNIDSTLSRMFEVVESEANKAKAIKDELLDE